MGWIDDAPIALPPAWQVVAWTGNACYFTRFAIQWIASERLGRSVVPKGFWWLSVAGASLLGAYTWAREEPVLMLSYMVVLAIYLRNFFLRPGRNVPRLSMGWAFTLGLAAWLMLLTFGMRRFRSVEEDHWLWVGVAMVGTAFWLSRFIVQWLKSERRGVSYFPRTFWWLSLVGNVFLLAYVIHLRDVALIAGYSVGPVVQVRNLMLAHQMRKRPTEERLIAPERRDAPRATEEVPLDR